MRTHRTSLSWTSALLPLALLVTACCGGRHVRAYPAPAPTELLAHLDASSTRLESVRAETLSDVRVGKDRARLKVFIVAARGGRLRVQATNPNDTTASDLSSDGTTYCLLDANHDCGECGPATPESVGALLQIALPPEEIVTILFGGTPVLAYERAAVRWDDNEGHEILELSGKDHTQRIVLDGGGQRWDLLESEVRSSGRTFRIRHKDFHDVKGPDGINVRLPGRSFFEQPGNDALIVWKTQEVNAALAPQTFTVTVPPGLRTCAK